MKLFNIRKVQNNRVFKTIRKMLHIMYSYLPSRWLKRTRLRNKLYYYTLIFGVFLVGIPIVLWQLSNPTRSDAAWFNDAWLYRQLVPITNEGTEQSEFQILVTVDTETLIAAGKMQTDCDDVRFTGQNGDILPYFQATACDAAKTRYWVKVKSIPGGNSSIYLYYGNTTAPTGSDRDTTFDLGLMGAFSQTFADANIASNHGASSDRENNFYISQSTYVNRFDDSWTFQEQFGSLDIYTGLCYDDKNDRFYGIDWGSKQWSTFDTSFTEIAPMDQSVGNQPIDCATDSTYIYTNHRNGLIGRNNISDNTSDTFNMDTLSGFNWGGQGLTYAFGYLFAGTSDTYGANGNRIYVIDIQDWDNPRIVTSWDASGHDLSEVAGLTWKDKYIYQTSRGNDFATEWTGPVKTAATEPEVGSPTNEEQSPGPLAQWKFDEGVGSVVNDSADNGYSGNISGASWRSESDCLEGRCLYFDGEDDEVTITKNPTLPSGAFTLSTWVKPAQADTIGFIFWESESQIWYSNNTFHVRLFNGSTSFAVSSSNNKIPNQWYYVTFIYTGSEVQLYVNGQAEGTWISASGNANSGASARFGRDELFTTYFKGLIDETTLYPYVRTEEQVQTDYNQGAAAVLGASNNADLSNGLVGYWKMDENTGTDIIDFSGNSKNATLQNSASWETGKFGSAVNTDNSTSDRVLITGNQDIGAAWSASTWFKYPLATTGSSWWTLFRGNGGDHQVIVSRSSDLLGMFSNSDGGFRSSGFSMDSLSDGWHHLSVVGENGEQKYYINGEYVGTSDRQSTTDIYAIGNCTCNSQNWGTFDETRLYNRALSPTEIQQLYNFAPGPVGYWDFEEGSGDTVVDQSGNANTGTWTSGEGWIQGKYGKGGSFNGTNYVSVSDTAGLDAGTMTVSGWVYPTAFTSSAPIYNRRNSSNVGGTTMEFSGTDGTVRCFYYIDGGWRSTTTTLTLNTWQHLSCSYDGTAIRIYLDGVFKNSTTYSGAINSPSSPFVQIGKNAPGSARWNGSLDEIRVYNYARTPGQIIEDMNADHPIGGSPVGSQVGYWKFDEGTGTTANNSGNGGTALNGTISGATWTSGKHKRALNFDGSTSYVNMGDQSALDMGTDDFSISAWTKITDNDAIQWIAGKSNAAGAGTIGYDILYRGDQGGNQLQFRLGNDNVQIIQSSGIDVGDGQWHHIVVTADRNSNGEIWVDGQRYASASINSAPASGNIDNSLDFTIGRRAASASWFANGIIDEVKVYRAALTEEQIQIDYNGGQSLQFGVLGTETDGTPSNSSDRMYCPPGDTTATCQPVGEWKFDERQGTSANDTSGNGHTGTISGATWTTGSIGAGLSFDGTDDNMTVPNDAAGDFNPSGAVFSVQAWVKTTDTDGTIVSAGSATTGDYWRLGVTGGKAYFGINPGGATDPNAVSSADVNDGNWHHIAGTRTGARSSQLYVDGILVDTVADVGGSLSAIDISNDVYFGTLPDGATEPLDGVIDHAQYFQYVLSGAQVAWNYNRGAPVAHYKLNECQGSTVHSSSKPYDSSLNGTITIGATGTQTSAGTCQTADTAWGNGEDGKFNSSLNFDGTDDYFEISQPNIPTSPNLFAISGWLNPTNHESFFIVPNSVGIDQWIGYNGSNQRLRVTVAEAANTNQTNTYSSVGSIPHNSWSHFVVVINDRTVKIYTNGTLNTENTVGFDIAGWTDTWRIGQRGNSTFWYQGQMDDIQIFNYELTEDQIRNVYNNGAVSFQ